VRFLKRLFRRRRRRSTADESARIAHELERYIADAERLVASRRHDEALRVARDALRRFPTSSRLRSVVSFVRREQSNGRISELKQLLQSRREERDYRELASIYLDLNRNDAASEIMQRYCDDFPNSSDAHAQRGEVCLACYFGELFARDAWAAMEHLERAVEVGALLDHLAMPPILAFHQWDALTLERPREDHRRPAFRSARFCQRIP